ncbi:MAG: DMT family transporter [Acidobacteriota bacterium]|nr:MAG: DMT family transporter [Acidobacteriota bacterium]
MKTLWIGLALLIGALVPAQAAMNAKMRVFVINPLYSALINFCVGATALLLMLSIAAWQNQPGDLRAAGRAPLWAWMGGLIGSSLVLSGVIMVPRTGAAGYSASIITGQLIGALILDHYGMLGLSQRLVTPSRLAGLVFMLIGLWLVLRR